MNDLEARQENDIETLESLAVQARIYSESAARNLLELGRVLTLAKAKAPHGTWGEWVAENACMSVRTAQLCMQAYRRYGDKPQFARVDKSKLFKLLALPEGQEEQFIEDHDVSAMTAREVDRAVAEARAAAQAEIDAAKAAARAAEQRAMDAENRPPEIPEELADRLRANHETIQGQQAEIVRLADISRDALAEKQRLIQENNGLRRDLKERDEDMEAMQADFDRAQEALLNLQSAQARGETERLPADALTPDVFSMAVNQFIGTCCRMPQMGRAFSAMDGDTREAYSQSLRAVEDWARSARRALETIPNDAPERDDGDCPFYTLM